MLWHLSMNLSGCLRLYSITCVALHMQHHSQSIIMMLLINRDDAIQWRYGYFSDLLIWCIGLRKVKNFGWWCNSTTCALKRQCIGLGRILYINENELTCYPIQYNMSASMYPRGHRWDRILYNHMSWLHITPHMDMLIHYSTPWTIHPVSFRFLLHMRWSRMIFSYSSMCASTFSQHIINDFWLNQHSTFLFSS